MTGKRSVRAQARRQQPALATLDTDDVSVTVEGLSALSPPARLAFEKAVEGFGKDLFEEADRLEAGHRAQDSAVPQFTDWMVDQAYKRVRMVRYVPVPRRTWPGILQLIAGLLFVGAGAAAGFLASEDPKYISADAWTVLAVACVIVAIGLQLTAILVPRSER